MKKVIVVFLALIVLAVGVVIVLTLDDSGDAC